MRRRVATSDWGDYVEPTYIPGPGEGLVYFGAQVGWSPRRERQPEWGCRECGGVARIEQLREGSVVLVYRDHDPHRRDPEGVVVFDAADPGAAVPIRYEPVETIGLVTAEGSPIEDGDDRVCMGCYRWGRDNWLHRRMDREYAERGTNDPEYRLPEPPAEVEADGDRPADFSKLARFRARPDGNGGYTLDRLPDVREVCDADGG
jgi:hypothetical protein